MSDLDNNLESFIQSHMGKPSVVNMDGNPDWGPPSLTGQFQDEALWEQAGWSVKIFDLSKEEDVEEYQALLTASSAKDPQVIIVDQDREFCDSTDNWKALVTSVNIKYRNLKKKE